MSLPTKIILPGGRAIIHAGKLVTDAENCCCTPPAYVHAKSCLNGLYTGLWVKQSIVPSLPWVFAYNGMCFTVDATCETSTSPPAGNVKLDAATGVGSCAACAGTSPAGCNDCAHIDGVTQAIVSFDSIQICPPCPDPSFPTIVSGDPNPPTQTVALACSGGSVSGGFHGPSLQWVYCSSPPGSIPATQTQGISVSAGTQSVSLGIAPYATGYAQAVVFSGSIYLPCPIAKGRSYTIPNSIKCDGTNVMGGGSGTVTFL